MFGTKLPHVIFLWVILRSKNHPGSRSTYHESDRSTRGLVSKVNPRPTAPWTLEMLEVFATKKSVSRKKAYLEESGCQDIHSTFISFHQSKAKKLMTVTLYSYESIYFSHFEVDRLITYVYFTHCGDIFLKLHSLFSLRHFNQQGIFLFGFSDQNRSSKAITVKWVIASPVETWRFLVTWRSWIFVKLFANWQFFLVTSFGGVGWFWELPFLP